MADRLEMTPKQPATTQPATTPQPAPAGVARPAAALPAGLIDRTADHIRHLLEADSSGHDWWHIWRVWRMSRWLAEREGADVAVCELGALLHDVADWKFHGGDIEAGPRAARQWLASAGAEETLADRVAAIVAAVTFKGAGVATPTTTLEAACVQDADRLDAIGAIGVARAFAYGGAKGRMMHDPDQPPQLHSDFTAYRGNAGPTVNHFHEKLLLLRDRMQTPSGRAVAQRRHAFLEQFLAEFHAEWDWGTSS